LDVGHIREFRANRIEFVDHAAFGIRKRNQELVAASLNPFYGIRRLFDC